MTEKTRATAADYLLIAHTVLDELACATAKFAPMHSAHEGYAVILEELDELKAEVFKSPMHRDPDRIRDEAIQVAAMAIRFLADIVGVPTVPAQTRDGLREPAVWRYR